MKMWLKYLKSIRLPPQNILVLLVTALILISWAIPRTSPPLDTSWDMSLDVFEVQKIDNTPENKLNSVLKAKQLSNQLDQTRDEEEIGKRLTLQLIQKLIKRRAEFIISDNKTASLPWFMRGGHIRPTEFDAHAQLFPEDAPGDDRIINQLMFTLPKDANVSIKRIFIANGLSEWGVPAERTEFSRNKCPVDQCALTDKVAEASTADAILYKKFLAFYANRPSQQIWIAFNLESHNDFVGSTPPHSINWTASYRRNSEIVTPYERWVYYDPNVTQILQNKDYSEGKTKMVAWFVSNCRTPNDRLSYAFELSKYVPIDIYGCCGNMTCKRHDPHCSEMLKHEYKFYLSFENSNSRDYITEKFFVNGLRHDVIPIVMGASPSEYAAVAPMRSYIHVEDFKSPKELAGFLWELNASDALYNSYFRWKGTGEFINTFFFCRLCAMLHAADYRNRTSAYADLDSWMVQE